MEEKEKNIKLLISIIVIILVIYSAYFIYSTYRKNTEKTADEIVTPVTTEEGYLQINTTGNNKERASINKVNKNDDNTYTLKGVLISRYTITENEYDYLKNQVPLVVDGINYYFTWSEKYNKYIFISKENNKVYYLEKDKNSDNYFVNIDADEKEVYKTTDKKIEITIDENTECEIKGKNENITAKKLFEEQEVTYGIYCFEIKDNKCTKIVCQLNS